MNQRGRIPALLLSLVMVFSAFAVLPLQTAFADGEENIALGKPAYANRNSSNAAVITDGDDTTLLERERDSPLCGGGSASQLQIGESGHQAALKGERGA